MNRQDSHAFLCLEHIGSDEHLDNFLIALFIILYSIVLFLHSSINPPKCTVWKLNK